MRSVFKKDILDFLFFFENCYFQTLFIALDMRGYPHNIFVAPAGSKVQNRSLKFGLFVCPSVNNLSRV